MDLTLSEEHASLRATVDEFDDVPVSSRNLIGERGRGYAQFLSILDEGRVAIAALATALATGLAQGCVDESLHYARERIPVTCGNQT
jgi:alkylation response protein AidB-like acyl-CoA dehydrogenase